MSSLCTRHLPRLTSSLPRLSHHPILLSTRHSSTASNSPYYLHRFLNSKDQYILLLPRSSIPLGRITIPTPPKLTQFSTEGPTIDFISPLSEQEIAENQHTFIENPSFRKILQGVVRENIAEEEMIRNEAATLQTGEGWIHLCDERQLPAFGRIPEVEDIIGSVLVKEGKVMPETYEGMATYRLVTTAGPMKLSEFMLSKLREKLKSL